MIKGTSILALKLPHAEIPAFIKVNNIAYALHTRPRNMYDDLTFPIKAFDFLSFQLPFFTEPHIPLQNLLSNAYPLFVSFEEMDGIHWKIKEFGAPEYKALLLSLRKTALNNTYDKRYQKLLEQ